MLGSRCPPRGVQIMHGGARLGTSSESVFPPASLSQSPEKGLIPREETILGRLGQGSPASQHPGPYV